MLPGGRVPAARDTRMERIRAHVQCPQHSCCQHAGLCCATLLSHPLQAARRTQHRRLGPRRLAIPAPPAGWGSDDSPRHPCRQQRPPAAALGQLEPSGAAGLAAAGQAHGQAVRWGNARACRAMAVLSIACRSASLSQMLIHSGPVPALSLPGVRPAPRSSTRCPPPLRPILRRLAVGGGCRPGLVGGVPCGCCTGGGLPAGLGATGQPQGHCRTPHARLGAPRAAGGWAVSFSSVHLTPPARPQSHLTLAPHPPPAACKRWLLAAPSRLYAWPAAARLQPCPPLGAHPAPLACPAAPLQLDNPSPWVALPVTLMVPAPISRLTSTVAAAVELQRRPAVVARLELWQRRPAGVLCVEEADLQLAPVAVFVEQRHALQLAEFLGHLSASFAAAEAAATAAAATLGAGRADGTSTGAPAAALPGSAAGDTDGCSLAGSEASLHAGAAGSAASAAAGVLGGGSSAVAAPPTPLRLPGLPPEVAALLGGSSLSGAGLAPTEQKVYIDVLRIATLELTVSFMPAPFESDPGAGHATRHPVKMGCCRAYTACPLSPHCLTPCPHPRAWAALESTAALLHAPQHGCPDIRTLHAASAASVAALGIARMLWPC